MRLPTKALMRLMRSQQLSSESVEYLGEVVRCEREPTKYRVAAAKRLIMHEHQVIAEDPMTWMAQHLGSDESALLWLEEQAAKFRERVEARRAMLPPAQRLESGDGEGLPPSLRRQFHHGTAV